MKTLKPIRYEEIKRDNTALLDKLKDKFSPTITENTILNEEFCRLNIMYDKDKSKKYSDEELQVLSSELLQKLLKVQLKIAKEEREKRIKEREKERIRKLKEKEKEIRKKMETVSDSYLTTSLHKTWSNTKYKQIDEADVKRISYDLIKGTLVNPYTNQKVIWDTADGRGTIYGLVPARICWYLITGVNPKENISYLDGNDQNLSPRNLYGVSSSITLDKYITEETLFKKGILFL